MKRYNTIIVYLVYALVITSCASTSVTPFRDPAFTGKPFKRMLILTKDFDERFLVERTVSSQLAKYSVTGIPSMEIFLPTRTYTANEIMKLLIENDIDSMLIFQLTGKERAIESPLYLGLDVFESKWQAATNICFKPVVYFVIELYDVSSGKLVWVDSTFTGGNVYADTYTWIDFLADNAIKKLQENRFIE